MCILHWTFLVMSRYRGSNRGPRHTLYNYGYSSAVILAIVLVLFVVSWVMMSMDQFYDAKIPKRGAALPAMIGGVILMATVLELAALHETLFKLWLDYRIERLHNSRAAEDPNAPAPMDYSPQDTMDAELEEASRVIAQQRAEASRYGEPAGRSEGEEDYD